jgi:hypothetical protein
MDLELPDDTEARVAFICENIRALTRPVPGDDPFLNVIVALLWRWQYGRTAIRDCFAILTSVTDDRTLFIAVKIIQDRVRNAFRDAFQDCIPESSAEVIQSIAQLMKSLVSRERKPESLVLNAAMLTYCDIITLTGDDNFDQDWVGTLSPEVSIRFWGYLFESDNERFWNKYVGIPDKIQRRLVPVGLQILNETPVSLFWLRMLAAIVANLPSFGELIPLVPRLFDAIESTDMIRVLIELAANIYSANLSSNPLEFLVAFIEFTAEFSAQIRAIIHESGGNSELETLLFCFWASFFQLNDEIVQSDACLQPMNAALSEFLTCTSECHIDEDVIRSLFSDAWRCLEYFFPPHRLQSVVPVFFHLCVNLLNDGTDEDALRETVSQFANSAPVQLLDFVTSYVAQRGAPDRGIIIVVAENLETLVKKDETREPVEPFAERLVQLILSTPIDDGCAFTFVKNFAAFDACQAYVVPLVEWLYRMFGADPARASEALRMLAASRSATIVAQRVEAIPAFAAFLPAMGFLEQRSLLSALLHLVNAAPAPDVVQGVCGVIGSQLMQVTAAVVRGQNPKECARLLSEFRTLAAGPPPIDAGPVLSQFTDPLVHSILREFGEALYLTEDGDSLFHYWLCMFLRAVLQSHWVCNTRVIAEWCERIIAAGSGTTNTFLVIPFLPVEQMPVTAAFLRELRVRDDQHFNEAMTNLLWDFTDRRDFTAFFHPEIVVQLIDWCSAKGATLSSRPLEVLERILKCDLVPFVEFYVRCFEFLVLVGFRRSYPLHKRLGDVLTSIAAKFGDPAPLRAIVAEHCDATLPVARSFISAVIDHEPPDVYQAAAEQFFKEVTPR